MVSGIPRYLTILVSVPVLLGCVGMILMAIVLLKKGNKYSKLVRGFLTTLLIIFSGIAMYLLYLAFAFG